MIEVIKVVLLGKKGGETASNHCWTEGFWGGAVLGGLNHFTKTGSPTVT